MAIGKYRIEYYDEETEEWRPYGASSHEEGTAITGAKIWSKSYGKKMRVIDDKKNVIWSPDDDSDDS